jgi:hypothetical protein
LFGELGAVQLRRLKLALGLNRSKISKRLADSFGQRDI